MCGLGQGEGCRDRAQGLALLLTGSRFFVIAHLVFSRNPGSVQCALDNIISLAMES